ncbi:hypothetical protein U1Q18_011588, partial [Sarracenia purpurea var. burkii]
MGLRLGLGLGLLVAVVLGPCFVSGLNGIGGEAKHGIADHFNTRTLLHGLRIGIGGVQGKNTTTGDGVEVSDKAGENSGGGGGGGGGGGA